jgi:serine protease Do
LNRKTLLTAVGLIFMGILIGVILITGLQLTGNSSAQQFKNVVLGNQTFVPKDAPNIKAINNMFIEAAKVATPTVVHVNVKSTPKKGKSNPLNGFGFGEKGDDGNDIFKFFSPHGGKPMPSLGSGSGVILTSDGYIITNNHVVADADEKDGIKVVLNDKREFTAKLVGRDPLTDIAVIKIDAKDLPAIPIGDSEIVQVGEWVLAVGNPFSLNSTVTAGIVSATGRNIRIIGDQYGVENFIQTDAAVNPGNSGGALVNLDGQLIGINAAIATETGSFTGYSFAVPINLAKSVAEDLIKYGKVSRGYIGVGIKEIDDITAKSLKLDKVRGILVDNLLANGAAKAAGVEQGDVILSVDGKEVNEPNQLQAYVARKHPNDKVVLKIWRDGKEKEITVTLKARDEKELAAANAKDDKDDDATPKDANTASIESLGLEVQTLSKDKKKLMDTDYGVEISDIDRFGSAAARGLSKGFVVLEVDNKKIKSADEFRKIIAGKKAGDAVLLKIKTLKLETSLVALEIPSK